MFEALNKNHIVAKPGFNRWLIVPAALGIHLCIGSVYAWSLFNPALTRRIGVVASVSDDWSLKSVVWIFSVAIVCLGLAAAFAGKWLEEVGPRKVGVVAAFCWGGGFLVSGLGIVTGQLSLLYLGYGVIGGCGLGLGYVSPVSTLIRWFPDRRGMATGLAIMGFGGGAMIATFMIDPLIEFFYKAPQYLGSEDAVTLVTEGSRRLVEMDGQMRQVVVVGINEAKDMIVEGNGAGIYLLGTGDVGIAQTFFVLGVVYFVVMILAAFSYRVPPKAWKPEGWTPPEGAKHALITRNNVHIDTALKTPQFYQLWIILCFNVTAGIGVISVAKTMITEIFSPSLPHIVTVQFTSTYVLMISVFNMLGRIFWASASDYIGRRNTYWCFFIFGILLYCSIPAIAHEVGVNPSVTSLVMFYAATMIIFTMYGGGFATIPAYLADIFGTRYVGGIHGRLLTAWSCAGIIGPLIITSLRESSYKQAAEDLAKKIDPESFAEHFGAKLEQLPMLVEQKIVTISKLMEISPKGTVDPTSRLYDMPMYVMAVLLFVALISNAFMRSVHSVHHMEDEEEA
ncbi:MAG: OFA family MFS transporter [Candidatus Eutrophobiaceae bacterium]